jgi:uncharacterized membrane protein YphA (DoxX/SURF4 family)
MKKLIALCRILVGSLFIISGLIKVNDAVGFAYKLEEYFSEKALGFPELLPYTLPIAIIIVVGEVLLGVATLLGAWPKFTSTLILAMTLFFTWLTYYTWQCDPQQLKIFTAIDGTYYIDTPECVLTCGCFGDAIVLTPFESFLKDIFLLPFILPFFIAAWRNKVKLNTLTEDLWIGGISVVLISVFSFVQLKWGFPMVFTILAIAVGVAIKQLTKGKEYLMALGVLLVCAATQYYTVVHLPLRDFRAYAIGQNLVHNMKSAEELGLEPPKLVNMYMLKNEKTGEMKEVDSDTYLAQKMWEDKTWVIQKDKTYSKKIKDGYEPKILDFMAQDLDGNDLKDSLLAMDRVFLFVMWNLEETDKSVLKDAAEFANKAQAAGIPVYGFTTADYNAIEDLRHEHQLAFPFLQGDEKVLKTMIRANPGLMYLEKATVMNMWSGVDIPNFDKASANGFKP